MSDMTLKVLQQHVGGCREWVEEASDKCWEPAEFVLWGQLIPLEGHGPRCHRHAARHVASYGLEARSGYALINLNDLARDLTGLDISGLSE